MGTMMSSERTFGQRADSRQPDRATVWVHYPALRHHSEVVYHGAEGVVYFGGAAPAGVMDMVWTGLSFAQVRPLEPAHRLLILEPEIVEPISHSDDFLKEFPLVYTFGKSELVNVKHYRMGIPPLWPQLRQVNYRPWTTRRNAVVCVTGNKYPERLQLLNGYAKLFAAIGLPFDVYGRPGFYDQPYYRGEVQGAAEAKRLLLSQYRYCLALENTCDNELYLTEKLLDGIISGCFCFYYGGPVQESYPEIPWDWVASVEASSPASADDHVEYLGVLTERMHQIRNINLDPLWRMILEDTGK
jgi:hypothetical protein